jgi:D-glycero-alpha-D-manno-heptose 1-phosphate guanylyltransferase
MLITEAIILAGGRGTRLRSVISDVPKPMAKIGNKPFLEILIGHYHRKGIKHFILSVGYMSEIIINHFQKKYRDIQITFSVEHTPLGTGGAIRLAAEHLLTEYALVLNGDSLLDINLNQLDVLPPSSLPVIFARHVEDVARFGQLLYNGDKIHGFVEKKGSGAGFVNAGVYVLEKSTMLRFPKNLNFSIESEYFSNLSENNPATILFSYDYFIDIGIPKDYQAAQYELLPFIKNRALFLDRDGVINIDTKYMHKPEDCIFNDGILDLLKAAKSYGYLIIVITNQSGIGRGYYTEETFHQLMHWMNNQLDNLIDDYYFCPFHAEHGIGDYKCDSYDRKPNPGMFEKAIQKNRINAEDSLMIGDQMSDLIAAQRAGIQRTLLVNKTSDPIDKIKTIHKITEAIDYL